jgi:hypothetical protein
VLAYIVFIINHILLYSLYRHTPCGAVILLFLKKGEVHVFLVEILLNTKTVFSNFKRI